MNQFWFYALPVLAIIVGVLIRAVVPYLLAALKKWGEGQPFPFEKRYWLAPSSAFFASLIQYAIALATQPNLFADLSALGFIGIVSWVAFQQTVVRWMQKAAEDVQPS
jgi:hypothetical protein